jgi:glycosyltransferase involved in cell wall biosynthesis
MPYPNGVDIEKISEKDGTAIRKEYGLDNSMVIIYVGAMDKARSLDILINAFARVKGKIEKVKLLMVGEGNDRENLQRLASSLHLSQDIVFTGYVEGSRIPEYIAASDIGISPVPPLDCYKIGSPVKLFEYLGRAKPVVANEEIYDQKEVIEQSGGGIAVPYNSDAFTSALIYLLENKEESITMGKKGREWIVYNRSYEILARALEKRYLALINNQ